MRIVLGMFGSRGGVLIQLLRVLIFIFLPEGSMLHAILSAARAHADSTDNKIDYSSSDRYQMAYSTKEGEFSHARSHSLHQLNTLISD